MKKLKKIIFVKILLLFLLTLFNSCSNNNIEKETIILAKTKISSLDITIGDNIIYEVKIISKKEIDYKFEDISFDERASQTRIIEVENETKNIGNYKERIIKYRIGFYDIGRFVIFPFKISYNYNNQYKELNGDDINILVNSFSDGEILPPLKSTLSIPMTKYFFIIILMSAIVLSAIIILILFIIKYLKKKFKEKAIVKEDEEALNDLKNIDYKIYFSENKFAEFYFELTFIFKRYLTKRFLFNIEDMTTSEINQLFYNKEFKKSDYIINMLKNSDYVKFAKQIPKIETMKKDYDFCKDYIIENGNLYNALKIEEKEKKIRLKKLKRLKRKKKDIIGIIKN